jgi:RNA recognition motif-containing protein
MTEDRLRDMFARCGEIVEVKAMPHKHYAFVRFTNKDHASHAINTWAGQIVDGKEVNVKVAGVYGNVSRSQKQGSFDPLYSSHIPSTTLINLSTFSFAFA